MKTMHEGHRERMYERLENNEKLQDHELLEVLLFFALPRVNTNEIAHSLIEAFGSLPAVFHASVKQLEEVKGIGSKTARFLYALGLIMRRCFNAPEDDLPYAYSFESFATYLLARHRGKTQECVEFYIVQKDGRLKFCKQLSPCEGSLEGLSLKSIGSLVNEFHPKEIIAVQSRGLCPCEPSPSDDLFTKKLYLYFDLCGVKLKDHFIVNFHKAYSYLHDGKMDEICSRCTSDSVVKKL